MLPRHAEDGIRKGQSWTIVRFAKEMEYDKEIIKLLVNVKQGKHGTTTE